MKRIKTVLVAIVTSSTIPRNGVQRYPWILIWAGQGVLHVPNMLLLTKLQGMDRCDF